MIKESRAMGDIRFQAQSKADLERLVRLFSTVMKQGPHIYYETSVLDSFNSHLVRTEVNGDKSKEYSFTSPFKGLGRWSFETNVDNLGKWFEKAISGMNECQGDNRLEEDKMRLVGVNWCIHFHYSDFEEHCQLLETVDAKCIHVPGTEIGETSSSILSRTEHEYDAENLVHIAGETEAWDLSPDFVSTALYMCKVTDVYDWLVSKERNSRKKLSKDLSNYLIKTCPDTERGCPFIGRPLESDAEQIKSNAESWMENVKKGKQGG